MFIIKLIIEGLETSNTLKNILDVVQALQHKLNIMAKTLDEVLADAGDESTKIDSLLVIVDGIEQQLKDALSGVTLPPAAQTKVDAIFDNIESNKAKVQAAIDKNTGTTGSGGTPTPPPDPGSIEGQAAAAQAARVAQG